ncbi:MAG: hypothetical protein ACR2FX_08405 [Chthoniobacterales bacterium]
MDNVVNSKAMPRGMSQAEIFESRSQSFLLEWRGYQKIRLAQVIAKAGLCKSGVPSSDAGLGPLSSSENLQLKRIQHFQMMQPGNRQGRSVCAMSVGEEGSGGG